MAKVRAAVIGSGFGGLALAIRLQAAGCRTMLFEKRDQAGGRAYVYRDQGFTFDAGPTVITAPDCLRELFTLAGRSMDDYVELLPVNPFYRLFWEDGYRFDYSADQALIERQIEKKSPADVAGYKQFLKYSEEVFREGYEKLAHVPFLNWSSMVLVAPQLIRLKAYRSVYSMVAKHVRDPHLRQLFSFHSLLVGGNPFTTTSIYTLIHCLERKWGVFFPKGGTGALVRALVKLFNDLGGEIRFNAEIAEISTSGDKVTGVVDRNGHRQTFDLVASNADVVHTYDKLLGREPRAQRMRKRLAKMNYSMSLFLIYFGTRRKYPNLLHHNIIFGQRYRELLQDILAVAVWLKISRFTCTRRANPIRIWRHPAVKLSMCFPRCRTWASSISTGASKGRAMLSAYSLISNSATCRTCAARSLLKESLRRGISRLS